MVKYKLARIAGWFLVAWAAIGTVNLLQTRPDEIVTVVIFAGFFVAAGIKLSTWASKKIDTDNA